MLEKWFERIYNNALDDGDLMFWDISAETQTVKFAEKCPVSLYTILAATELSFNCIDAPTYSRA